MSEKDEMEETNFNDIDYTFALEQAGHWIDSADSKTGIALTLVSITFTLFSGFLLDKQVFTADINPANRISLIILTLFSFLMFALSIAFYCKVLIPRFEKPKTKDNPYYYYEVSMYERREDFVDRFINEKNRLLVKGQLESLYENSKIALTKMKYFKIGFVFTILFFVFSMACIILALFTPFPTENVNTVASSESSLALSNTISIGLF